MTGKLGSYEILEPLGKGGMGEVYRAHDPNLKREVAIKVLPAEVASDPDRLARLEREAHSLAALNHPNVATIHGLEEAETEDGRSSRFLVLELIEGETLEERLRSGPLGLEEALEIAVQIGRGLEVAHASGIIHRDLKPGNIKITPDGLVKVLDFGLAKPDAVGVENAENEDDLTRSPTVTVAGTEAGVILGTAAYMSPEQTRGQTVDTRSDIWSFGCVLFEMLAGRRPFTGENVSDTLASILKEEADWELLPPGTPPLVESLLGRCLRKDPDRRVHHIVDARIEIEEAISALSQTGADDRTPRGEAHGEDLRPSRRLTTAIWGLTLLLAAVVAFGLGRSWSPEPGAISASRPIRHPVSLPVGTRLASSNGFAISPDGLTLVYAARRRGQQPVLYRHPLDELEGTPISGTEGAHRPFFSADGRWVGFVRAGDLWKVSVEGGRPLFICEMPGNELRGAHWLEDDTIVFAGTGSALLEVPAGGGVPREITDAVSPDRFGHRLPWVLPGGRGILFYAFPGDPETGGDLVAHLDRDTGQVQVVRPGAVDARYLPTGHLVWADLESNSHLAAAFDLDGLEVGGRPQAVLEDVFVDDTGSGYRVSLNGTLVYRPSASATGRLAVVDREGNERPLEDFERQYQAVRVSSVPDRRLLAADGPDGVWILDLDRPGSERLLRRRAGYPAWSPDGRTVYYSDMTQPTSWSVQRVAVGEGGEPTPLITVGYFPQVISVHPDGETVLYQDEDEQGNWMVYVARIGDLENAVGTDPREVADPLVPGGREVQDAHFSPDGEWIAYVSWETGDAQVYVRPFAEGQPATGTPVSTAGGMHPVWHRDGGELFYLSGQQQLSVSFTDDDGTPRLGRPTELFTADYVEGTGYWRAHDVLHDGSFLKLRPQDRWTIERPQLVVVRNWFEELERLVPGAR